MNFIIRASSFVGRTFAVWVLVFASLGFFLPTIFSLFAPYIVILLGIIMFGMGLTISPSDFAEVTKRPFEVLIGVLSQFIIMPIIAFALTKIFQLPPEIAAGVMETVDGVLAMPLVLIEPRSGSYDFKSKVLFINSESSHSISVELFTLDGKRLFSQQNKSTISLQFLNKGVYIMKILDDQNSFYGLVSL